MTPNWLQLFQPDEPAAPASPPEPNEARDRRARVALLERRYERQQHLWHLCDWIGDLDPAAVHEENGTPGEAHAGNGSDRWTTEIGTDIHIAETRESGSDAEEEAEADQQKLSDLPPDWLEQELAAFQSGQFPLREYEPYKPAERPDVLPFTPLKRKTA